MTLTRLTVLILSSLVSIAALATVPPPCLSGGAAMPPIDAQVLQWKHTTPNQHLERAHIVGDFVRVSMDRATHFQMIVQIGPQPTDLIELIYNKGFGGIPPMQPGMRVEACGDFINAFAATPQYPASPAGAIMHWIHCNPNSSADAHPGGFLMIGDALTGMQPCHGSY